METKNRWNLQKDLVERIAKITTRIIPQDEGVALRFINQEPSLPDSSSLRLDDIKNILNKMPQEPKGGTKIGTNLESKILQPLVYDKITSKSKSFERPLLISILTDGAPSGEDTDRLKNVIVKCSRMLNDADYSRESEYSSYPIRD